MANYVFVLGISAAAAAGSPQSSSNVGLHAEPGFIGHLKNVTVPEGRDVTLSCTVKNLQGHKVCERH